MKTVLVSGSDTGAGKTRVTSALARLLREGGASVRILKPVESGRATDADGSAAPGDALFAARAAGLPDEAARTPLRFAAPLAPLAAAAAEGRALVWDELLAGARDTPACDWLLIEGAGGLAVPLAADGRDWADYAAELAVDAVVLVVPDRLGAINQARLALAYAEARGLRAGVVLNEVAQAGDAAVAASNREGLRAAGAILWGELAHESWTLKLDASWRAWAVAEAGAAAPDWPEVLARRERDGLRREVRVHAPEAGELNLAANDYLGLARDPVLAEAAAEAAREHGTSASASPLITGWRRVHEEVTAALCAWHGFGAGLLWNSGYAANSAVLGVLPRAGDLVLADRLIHHSMVAGVLRGAARLRRYAHLDLGALERLLVEADEAVVARGGRVFVVTESVFSMDGDYPDLRRMAELRRRFGFCWILDEAHALGWYGATGAGLAQEQGVAGEVDVLVGTGGKALGAGGGYTLFNGGGWREVLVNHAGEFIYSTGLPPPTVAALGAGVRRAAELAAAGQAEWRAVSREFRARLRAAGWDAGEGDSPVVPVRVGDASRTMALAERLRAAGIVAAAVRPPTVPAGTSRLRVSLTRDFGAAETERVLEALGRAGA